MTKAELINKTMHLLLFTDEFNNDLNNEYTTTVRDMYLNIIDTHYKGKELVINDINFKIHDIIRYGASLRVRMFRTDDSDVFLHLLPIMVLNL